MSNFITYPLNEPFLERLAEYIEENFIRQGKALSRLAIVFGGKRPSIFLRRELARRIGKTFFPPRFFTIDEFMSFVVKRKEAFTYARDLDHCYLIFHLASELTPKILKGRSTFAEFLPWAKEILSFIDQLDLENVSGAKLKAIESNARIGYPVPKDINELLESIVLLREAYHASCGGRCPAYSRGLLYLRASQVIGEINLDEFDQILFANFFYFNHCEENVLKVLRAKNKATLIFQGDERQWPVLKRASQNFGCSIKEADELTSHKNSSPFPPQAEMGEVRWGCGKEVKYPILSPSPSPSHQGPAKAGQGGESRTHVHLRIYSGFDTHAQVGIVREILKQIPVKEKTVIVLPEPNHLIPLISEIASLENNFNVSMGYPLRRSSLYVLFGLIFKAQLSQNKDRYYTKDYLNVLRHPFVKNLKLSVDPAVTRVLAHKIEEILTGKEKTPLSGSLFINLDALAASDDLYLLTNEMLKRLGLGIKRNDLRELLSAIHEILFKDWEPLKNFKEFSDTLGKFMDIFIEKSALRNYPLNLNIAERVLEIQTQLRDASFKEETFLKEEIFRIFDNKIASELVSFTGTPLKGLQILGLFETRSLNFDHVIVMDVNEGILPRLKIYDPLIPREVMVSLNLDRLELEEEIQRYQFTRLMASAKDVHLIYEEGKEKERSRFIEELIWEKEKRCGDLNRTDVTAASFQVKVDLRKESIKKTPAMIEFLRKFSYSASSVNTYLRDPMEFYYKYVLGLEEKEDLLDEPEARHVGTFIHALLEESFKPFLGKAPSINAALRNRVKRLFDDRFEETFGKTLGSDAFLLRSVLEERINRFLDNEEKNLERKVKEILYLEHRFEDTIPLSVGPIKFKYIVDRVDRLEDGTIMIVDYKTGFIDQMPKAIERILSLELTRENIYASVKSFQIPLYFHYLNRQFPNEPINAALYNFRTLDLHKFIDQKMTYSREQINQAFLRVLDFTLQEICDENVAFVQNNP